MKRIRTQKKLSVNVVDTGTKTEKKKRIVWKKSGPRMVARLRHFEPVPFKAKKKFTPAQKKYIVRHLEKYRGAALSDLKKIKLTKSKREALARHGYVVTKYGVVLPKLRGVTGFKIKGASTKANSNGSIRQQVGRQVTVTIPIDNRADFVRHTEERLKEFFKRYRVTEKSTFRLVAGVLEHADEFEPAALHHYLLKKGFFGRNFTAVRYTYYLPKKRKKRKGKKKRGKKQTARRHKRL